MKFVKKNWIWILLVVILLILLGIIKVTVTFEYFTNNCPKTQNCSKNGIIHECNEKALDIAKTQYLDKINNLTNEVDSSNIEISDLESKLANIQNNASNQNNQNKTLLSKYDSLETSYKNVNDQLNTTKELLKQEQDRSIYTQIPNFSCDCTNLEALKNVSLDQCKSECDKHKDCNFFNYYEPQGLCNLGNKLDYTKLGKSSWDMYIKNTQNGSTFNVNNIKLSSAKTPTINDLISGKFTLSPNIGYPGNDLEFGIDACKAACLATDGCENVMISKNNINKINGIGCYLKKRGNNKIEDANVNTYIFNK